MLTAEKRDGMLCVEVQGPRLDAASASTVKADLRDLIDAGERYIVLDLGAIDFMDSSGLGALVGCLKHMGPGGRVELTRPTEPVMKVLQLTRMDRIFTIRDLPPAA